MSLLEQYKGWVRNHPTLVATLESALSSITYLLPDRFASSEILYESFSSAVGLLSLWHDNITKDADILQGIHSEQLWLAALQQIETLVELRAVRLERYDRGSRYGALAVLEFIKAALRLQILARNPGRLVLRDGTSEEVVHEQLQENLAQHRFRQLMQAFENLRLSKTPQSSRRSSHDAGTAGTSAQPQHAQQSAAQKPGEVLSTSGEQPYPHTPTILEESGEVAAGSCSTADRAWWDEEQDEQRSLAEQAAGRLAVSKEEPCSSSSSSSACSEELWQRRLGFLLLNSGEVLHIYRPFIYVLLLLRHGRPSWRPWATSLLVDLASFALTRHAEQLIVTSYRLAPPPGASGPGRPAVAASPLTAPLAALRAGLPWWLGGVPLPPPRQPELYSVAMMRRLSEWRLRSAEERELLGRKVALAYYLLRSPFYDSVTRELMLRLLAMLRRVPLLGSVGDKAFEIVEGIQQYYTYTSAS